MYSLDELPWNERSMAEMSAPGAVARLIRTKNDALSIYRVIRGDVGVLAVGRFQCDFIGGVLLLWNTPQLTVGLAEQVDTYCDELDVLFQEHNDMMDLAAVRVPLFALAEATHRHANEMEKRMVKTNDPET